MQAAQERKERIEEEGHKEQIRETTSDKQHNTEGNSREREREEQSSTLERGDFFSPTVSITLKEKRGHTCNT